MSIEHNTELLCKASKTGNSEEVRRLIPVSNPKAYDSVALRRAAQNGHTECVKLLIPVSGIFNEALRWAAHNGHADCVKLLISVPQPIDGMKPLLWAAEQGHTECVQLLIPISDPREYHSRALQLAARNGHIPCVELLYPASDPIVALKILQENYPDQPEKWIALEQHMEAEEAKRLRDVLSNEVDEGADVRKHKI